MSLYIFLKSIVQRLSLKFKLFVLLILISIIPISLVSYSSEFFMFRSSTEYSASISSQYVEFVSKELSDYLQTLNESFDGLFINASFHNFLDTPADQLTEQANEMMRFRPLVRNSLQFHPEVLGVLYVDLIGKVYFDSYQKQLNPAYSFAADHPYKASFASSKPELTAPHLLPYILYSKANVFSYIRPILDTDTGRTEALFIIEIHEEKIKSMLSSNQKDKEGQVILYREQDDTTVSETPLTTGLMQDFQQASLEGSGASKQLLFTSGGREYQAIYDDLPGSKWKIVWMAPLSSINKGVRQTYQLTLLIAALSLVIALIIAFPVMSGILRPLYRLKKGMQSLGRGVYVPVPMKHHYDEIGFLIHSYNQTLDKLQFMEREVYQANMKEKERELLQLQAQINPHFLFNTLETIESYAVRNNGEAVGDMVQSVSRMMRYTIRSDDGWATLKEEMAYIRNFLKIHYYRNGKDVHAHFEIAPELLDFPVMKLSIQPYIENAIKYGWSPYMGTDEFQLTVKVRAQADAMTIVIYDTGTGISADVLDRLRQLIQEKGATKDPYFRKHTGIFNTFRRFILVYGEQVRFHVESTPERGTKFEFQIPYEHQNRGPA
ncbi:two-component sensor histidine kinase [Paenibacillus sp. FSL A5-0031]|uniref:cache domain-containing sensor histidine kinase n=1 Tax=Paenibacillus sp. FSL A5-0031 TaxID=1920420 RepID=UPI00096E2358|nr:sensor histidine kinase [Paenibacillus sp. FSL A5-0031]OME87799.1 two-component sensor histidine kinase [Paenibacillus sp. FSL A5-0031]